MLDAPSFTVACIKRELNCRPTDRDWALSNHEFTDHDSMAHNSPCSSYKNHVQCRNWMIPKNRSSTPSNMAGSSGNISSILLSKAPPDPLAFLPPHLAFQVKISELIIACSLAVCFSFDYIRLVKGWPDVAQVLIWDQLHTLSDDYQIAFKRHFGWPTAVYFISR